MMRLLLLGFFVAAVLFLIGALTSLYRFLTRSRLFPQLPRLWKPDRTRTMIFGGLLLLSLVGLFTLGLISGEDETQAEARDPSLYPSTRAARPRPPVTTVKGEERVLPPTKTPAAAPTTTAPATTQAVALVATTTAPAPVTTAAPAVTTTTQPAPTTTAPAPTTTTTQAAPPTTMARPKPKPAKPAPAREVKKPYWTVCFSSYRQMASAKKDAAALKAKGLAARIYKVEVNGKGWWYRVCVGAFPDMKASNLQAERWRKAGLVKSPFPYRVR